MQLNKLFGICILFLVLILVSYSVNALIGCCCDPVSLAGTFESDATCDSKNFNFIGVPSPGQTCSEYCNATQGIPAPSVNITVPSVGCGTPGFTKAPSNFVVYPVKGEKQLRLSFDLSCPVDYVQIYRCKGTDCSGFALVNTAGTSPFVDGFGLEFDSDYRYKIVAHYSQGSDSEPAFATGNLGDLDCWRQKNDEFCIHEFYYESFRDYLELFGYKGRSGSEFGNNFVSSVRSVFGSKLNKAWSCNDNNVLFQKLGSVSCSSGQICVSGVPRAKCVTPSPCEQGGIFGLFSSKQSCESQEYCFFDRSKTNVDFCFACSPRMTCSDYHSQSACTDNVCRVGDCEWRDIFSSIGGGVCIDKRFDNCPRCSQTPLTSIANRESYNSVFDACTVEKAVALSTDDYKCFFNKNNLQAVSCSDAVCDDFSRSQCGSPADGIKLASDNSVSVSSSDPCNIGVCYYSDSENRCFKDADANKIADCSDRNCEKDFLPPETSIFVSGQSGRDDYLNIKVKDKKYFADAGSDVSDNNGYLTFVCIGSCDDVNSFALVNSTRLNINDLELKDDTKTIANLNVGANTLKFFSVDPNRNVEVVKSITFFACDNCAGPKALKLVISKSNLIAGNYYASSKKPVFRIIFNEPAEITNAGLLFGEQEFGFSVNPSSGFNYEYVLTPVNDLADGKYLFSLNAKDENNMFMDSPLNFNLTIDTVFPSVSLSPEDNSFFDQGKIDVSIAANEPILLNASVDDVVFVNNYVAQRIPNSIDSLLTTENNRLFKGEVSGLSSGKKALSIVASDFAGNTVIADSFFFIGTGSPDFRLKSPSFGVSSAYEFDAVVETNTRAECRYLYNIPSPPPASEFAYLSKFSITGNTEHTLYGLSIPEDNVSKSLLYVYCKAEGFAPVRKTFELSIDTEEPAIITAFVFPEIVSDYIGPEDLRFMVELKVQTSEPAFCKYSYSTNVFDEMENKFPGYDEVLKESHVINITVEEEGDYTYYVECKDIADLKTGVKDIKFSVDTSVPFSVESVSERYQETSPLFLRVETNKHAFCYYGESENDISACFGNCEFGFAHVAQISKSDTGDYTFFVKCNNGAGGITTDVLPVAIGFGTGPVNVTPAEITHCEDNILNGAETDIDCGGACPGCFKGLNCVVDSDCIEGLFCVKSVCSEEDSDSDGVPDEEDECPETPVTEIADARGCSKSQRDADGDGMDDSWELRYGFDPGDDSDAGLDKDKDGLSNLEEFNYGTNPLDKDSDGDNWSDKKEIDKGFDPLDSESHPESILPVVFKIVLIIALILGLVVGGYFVAQRIIPNLKEMPRKKPELPPVKPVPKPADRLVGLRKMVKIGPPMPKKEPGWISFEDLKSRIVKKGPPDVWEKMRKISFMPKREQAPKKPGPKRKDTFAALKKIAEARKK
ncbi:hypothetical protein JW851_00410 [Candidatus Woesearchaeota archaeon]|nr:hypothetical protein [Candidatus Woesearchaeota archaeon]